MAITPDSTYSTLAQIQKKARLLSRAVDPNQLSDTDLNNYINTFILYDFPEHFRLFNFKTVLEFYTEPYVDIYGTTNTNVNDPLYNFKNKYLTVNPPVYIAGYQTEYTQSRAQFFGMYPNYASIVQVGGGDGTTTTFSGTINTAQSNIPPYLNGTGPQNLLLQNNVLINGIDSNGNGIVLIDDPQTATTGNMIVPNDTSTGSMYGTINYVTGVFSVTFPVAPAANSAINAQVVALTPARPLMVLFFEDHFVMRPVPDQVYKVTVEAYVRPTELMATTDIPDLAEFWQYIAYGAAKKILEDRNDLDTVQLIMPEFEKQGLLCQRRTLVQISTQRSATIYAPQLGLLNGYGQNGWGNFGNLG